MPPRLRGSWGTLLASADISSIRGSSPRCKRSSVRAMVSGEVHSFPTQPALLTRRGPSFHGIVPSKPLRWTRQRLRALDGNATWSQSAQHQPKTPRPSSRCRSLPTHAQTPRPIVSLRIRLVAGICNPQSSIRNQKLRSVSRRLPLRSCFLLLTSSPLDHLPDLPPILPHGAVARKWT
jgi:hypothetical protein